MNQRNLQIPAYNPNTETPTTFAARLIRSGLSPEEVTKQLEQAKITFPTLNSMINEFLAKENLSLTNLADISDVNPSTLHRYLNGERNAGRNTLIRIAIALNMTLDETQVLLKCGNRASLSASRKRDIVIMNVFIKAELKGEDMYNIINDELTKRRMPDLYGDTPEDKSGE